MNIYASKLFCALMLGAGSLLCNSIPGQTYIRQTRDTLQARIDSVNAHRCKTEHQRDARILTETGINHFFARRAAAVLSESGDLSFAKGYALVNTEDESLVLGINFTDKNPENERIRTIFTVAASASAKDDFAAYYSNGELSPGISGEFKVTRLCKGVLFFDQCYQAPGDEEALTTTSKCDRTMTGRMHAHRIRIRNECIRKMHAEDRDFVADTVGMDTCLANRALGDFRNSQQEKYLSRFYEMECDALEENQLYHSWIAGYHTFQGKITGSGNVYTVKDTFGTEAIHKKFLPWQLDYIYTFIYQRAKGFQFRVSGGTGMTYSNSAREGLIEEYTFSKYFALGYEDTLDLVTLSSDQIFVGRYYEFMKFTPSLDLYFLFCKDQNLGLHFGASCDLRAYTARKMDEYSEVDLTLGIPFRFTGRDEDTFVNFELISHLDDIGALMKNDADQRLKNHIVIGIKAGIPFKSVVY